MNIVTIEFSELDAFRLLFLVEEADSNLMGQGYWQTLAGRIRENIKLDLEVYGQIEYREQQNGQIGAVRQLAG